MKRTIWIIAGAALLLVLLASAAFVGGRLLADREQPGDEQPAVRDLVDGGEDVASQVISVEMDTAEGLPETSPDVYGIFQKREDKSLTVGTGEIKPSIAQNEDGSVDFQLTHTGPEVEVVVTGKTQVYKDVTEMSFDQPSGPVQQKVEPGSIDDIGSDSMVMVWGKRTGDRVVAQGLLYTLPQIEVVSGP